MNESTLTGALIRVTKANLPGSEIVKLADKATIGLPDMCVCWGETWWIEVKYLRRGHTLDREWKPIQRIFLRRLQLATGRALLFVYSDKDGEKGITATLYRATGRLPNEGPEIEVYATAFGPKRHTLLANSIKLMHHVR